MVSKALKCKQILSKILLAYIDTNNVYTEAQRQGCVDLVTKCVYCGGNPRAGNISKVSLCLTLVRLFIIGNGTGLLGLTWIGARTFLFTHSLISYRVLMSEALCDVAVWKRDVKEFIT